MKKQGWIILTAVLIMILQGLVFIGCDTGDGIGPIFRDPEPTPPPASANWLEYLNTLRSYANLPPVTEVPEFSEGNRLHARYMVHNDVIDHFENPGNPFYTPEGDAAARNSNLYLTTATTLNHEVSLNFWMSAPFHGVAMIDPALLQTGYGTYSANVGRYNSGAGLDIGRGRGPIPAGVTFPIMWPADGAVINLFLYPGGEIPDPLTGTGFTAPTGVPVYLLLGTGATTPNVTAHSFRTNNTALPHVVYDETSYFNPDPGSQAFGRDILRARNAVILIPRDPLVRGRTYHVSITVNGVTHEWSFSVAEDAVQLTDTGEVQSGK